MFAVIKKVLILAICSALAVEIGALAFVHRVFILHRLQKSEEFLESQFRKGQSMHARAPDHPAIFPQLGDTDGVGPIAFSPSGILLASGGGGKTINLWVISNGRELRTLVGHSGTVNSIAFSPDGKLLASGSADKTIRLWDVSSGHEMLVIRGHTDRVTSVAFSRYGEFLATGGADHVVKIWRVSNGSEIRTIREHKDVVTSVVFSPDGKVLASGSWDGTVMLWDLASRRVLKKLECGPGRVDSVAFSSDSRFLAVGNANKLVTLWDLKHAHLLKTLIGHANIVNSVAFSPDNKILASGAMDGAVKLWDVATGRDVQTLKAGSDWVNSVVFSPKGNLLGAGSAGTRAMVRLWSVADGQVFRDYVGHGDQVYTVLPSPVANILAAAGLGEDGVELWNLDDVPHYRFFELYFPWINEIAFSEDGRLLAAGSFYGNAEVVDTSSGDPILSVDGESAILSVSLSADGHLLAIGREDSTIELWDVTGSRKLHTLSGHQDWVQSVAISPDGQLLASGSWDNRVKLWNTRTGRLVFTFVGHHGPVECVRFSPNGRSIASGSDDGSIKIWDVASGRLLESLAGHAPVDTVAYSASGRDLASGSEDGTISVWSVAQKRVERRLLGHTNVVSSVAFMRDGNTLVSGSWDGTIRLWSLSTGHERISLMSFTDGSSIAVTPEGYFDSSSDAAEENLNVRIGERVFGISSFREKFYRPSLVKRALAGESLAHFGSIDTVKLSPVVEAVDTQSTTKEASLKLTLRLTNGGGGFGPITVYAGGTSVLEDDQVPRAPQPDASFTRVYTVPLLSGDNDLRVTADNADSSMSSESDISVRADLPTPSKIGAAQGTLHALIVGIPEFPRSPENNLAHTKDDAILIAETLKANASPLFGRLDIQALSLTAASTDKTHVMDALGAMQKSAHPDDEFVFFVASHGIVRGGTYYLLTSNATPDLKDLKAEAISGKELTTVLNNIPARKKLVIIDTCDSGAITDALKLSSANAGLDAETAVTILGRSSGLTVLAATTSSQDANEGSYKGHGLLTAVVNDGLTGEARDRISGIVSSFALADYVNTQVPLLAPIAYHHPQQPTVVKSGQSFPVTMVK